MKVHFKLTSKVAKMVDQLEFLKVSSIKPLDSVQVQDYLTVNRMNTL